MQVLVLHFQFQQELWKKLFKTAQNKNKNYTKIATLSRSKLNSIESEISKALINNEISHEVFFTIINEKKLSRIKY